MGCDERLMKAIFSKRSLVVLISHQWGSACLFLGSRSALSRIFRFASIARTWTRFFQFIIPSTRFLAHVTNVIIEELQRHNVIIHLHVSTTRSTRFPSQTVYNWRGKSVHDMTDGEDFCLFSANARRGNLWHWIRHDLYFNFPRVWFRSATCGGWFRMIRMIPPSQCFLIMTFASSVGTFHSAFSERIISLRLFSRKKHLGSAKTTGSFKSNLSRLMAKGQCKFLIFAFEAISLLLLS